MVDSLRQERTENESPTLASEEHRADLLGHAPLAECVAPPPAWDSDSEAEVEGVSWRCPKTPSRSSRTRPRTRWKQGPKLHQQPAPMLQPLSRKLPQTEERRWCRRLRSWCRRWR